MSDTTASKLFPLRLAPFEAYMLADDRPGYRMSGICVLEFDGQFDRADFESATRAALAAHPLFWANLVKAGLTKAWVAAPDGPLPIDWGEPDQPIVPPDDEAMDLRREVGFRLWIRQGGGRAVLTMLMHHTVSDALGILAFLGDLLAHYAQARGAAVTIVPRQPERLARRAYLDDPPEERMTLWTRMRETFYWFVRRPVPLAAPVPVDGQAVAALEFPGLLSHTFSASETSAMRTAAAAAGGTINDVLLSDLFVTIREWNKQHGEAQSRQWLQVALPTNLRDKADERMPAANKVSFTFLSRRPAQCDDWPTLLAGIARQTQTVKRQRRGQLFLDGLQGAQYVPGAFGFVLGQFGCLSTVVLSHVGDPTWHFLSPPADTAKPLQFGDVTLTRAMAAPPLRHNTRACIVVTRCAGCLTLALRSDRHTFSAAAGRRFLDAYVAELRRTTAGERK